LGGTSGNQKLVSGLSSESEIDAPKLPPDLAEIVVVWPELPGHIKTAIKALVQASAKETE
jgi:hypothetical protein